MRALLQSHLVAAHYTRSSADVASPITRLKSIQSLALGMQPCVSSPLGSTDTSYGGSIHLSSQMSAQFRRILVVIKSGVSNFLGEIEARDVGSYWNKQKASPDGVGLCMAQ
jgi:hypothetical protein